MQVSRHWRNQLWERRLGVNTEKTTLYPFGEYATGKSKEFSSHFSIDERILAERNNKLVHAEGLFVQAEIERELEMAGD